MRVQNHTLDWRLYGRPSKINLYYSWNYGCLQGIKVMYGTKASDARRIGIEKRLYSQHLLLSGKEVIVRVDVKQVGVVM